MAIHGATAGRGTPKSQMDDRSEPFRMAFTNREAAVIVADQLNRRSRGLWLNKVERHIDQKRWVAFWEDRELVSSYGSGNCATRRIALASG